VSGARTWVLFGLLAFIWGSTWLVIKVGLADLPPFLAAGLRFALAGGILAALARARKIPFPRGRREHALLLGVGMTMFWASYGIVYWAEQFIPSGLTAVLFATHPFFTLLLAHPVLATERITARKALGVGLLGRDRVETGHGTPRPGCVAALASASRGIHVWLPPSSTSRAQNKRSGMYWPIPGRNAAARACHVYSCASRTASGRSRPLASIAAMAEASVQPEPW